MMEAPKIKPDLQAGKPPGPLQGVESSDSAGKRPAWLDPDFVCML